MFNCFSILKLFTGTDVGDILKYAVIIIAILAAVFLFIKVEGVRWFAVIAIVLVVGFSGVYSGIKINQYYSAQGGIYGKLEDLIKSNQVDVEQSKTYINFNFSNVNLTENNYGYYSARFVSNDTITLDSNSQYFATVNSMPCKIVEYDKYHFVAKYNYSFYDEQNNYILTDELTFTFGMSQYVTELVVTSKNEDTRAVELWNVYFTKNDFIVKLETTEKVYISDSDMVTLSVYNQSEIAYQSVVPIGSSVSLDLSKFVISENRRPVGFSYDPEGINRIEDNTLVVNYSQRVYVVWEHKVRFSTICTSWVSNGTLLSDIIPSSDGLYDNWRFLGWSIDGENIIDVTKTRYDCSYYSLYAIWDKGTQITFYDYYNNDFSYGLCLTGDTLESVIPKEIPTDFGKKFLGWSLSNDNDVNKIVDLSTIIFDGTQTSIYPVYERAKIIVTFVPGETVSLFEGDEFSSKIPSNPEKTGYKFIGWSLSNDNDANSIIDLTTYSLTGDTTFYAVWSSEIMTVNFHLEGGSADFNGKTYSSDFSEILLYSEEFNLTNLFKENCTFYDFEFKFLPVTTSSTSLTYKDLPLTSSLENIFERYINSFSGDSDDTEPGEIREYPIYEFTSCEIYVTFLANSIDVSLYTDSELADYIGVNVYGGLAGSLDNFLTSYLLINCGYSYNKVKGYDYATKLQKFQDNFEGTLTIEDDTTKRDILEQIYLYYFYENNSVSVTFLVDDANYSSASVLKGSCATLPEDPTKEGYDFLGWSIDGENVIDITTTPVTSDTTYIAVFYLIATFDTDYINQLTTFNSAIKRDTISSVSFLTGSEKTEKLGTLSSGIDVYYSIDDNGLYELDFVANKIFAPVSCASLFTRFKNLILLNFINFDTCNVTDMSYMFYNCVSLTTLDLSNFVTSNVTNMLYLFDCCNKLTTLYLSNFDTCNVTNMMYMFDNCRALATLDLSNFDTSNVTDMSYMFNNCGALATLDLSNFDTSNVTDMSYMFSGCASLTTLIVRSFVTNNVTSMMCMFGYCSILTTLDLSNFDTSIVFNMSGMFSGCRALITLNLSNFDTRNVTSYTTMYSNCSALTEVIVGENYTLGNLPTAA